MSQPLQSLDEISGLVLAERDAQVRHVESLDTKAGIVLGFAGAVVALGTRDHRNLRADPSFTRLHVLDTTVQMIETSARLIRSKSRRLRASMTLLVLATALLTADSL